eukprot:TRINITY_DN67323_c0_g1_i1.p1 TRINITY_DN67323_c0_g1~~TRINITY_DN67323_c0_g1_i1.p1  ORF type:complete len:439 (-),score=70.99 TRINITY_DN67323_c0_g1_i1:83-1399(-)
MASSNASLLGSLQNGGLHAWSDATPIDPGDGLDAGWVQQFPLSVQGRHIVNKNGERFRLRGVNWYGASDSYHVAGGLDVQSLEAICRTITELGFNTVRLPFSNEMLRSEVVPGSIDFDKNPQLRGLSALEVMDKVVQCLGREHIAVILNNHTTYGEWCGGPDRNGLWFDPGSKVYTAAQWEEDWAFLAARYERCPQVVGFDLRNEVRFSPWPFRWPAWAVSKAWRFCGAHDWAEAAANCAARLLKICPDRLIVVERIIWPMRGLQSYAAQPGPLLPRFQRQLVLGVHHYSWNGPGRYLAFGHQMTSGLACFAKTALRALGIFSKENYGDMPSDRLHSEIFHQWGYLLEGNHCPVWISEFGTCARPGYDLEWFSRFVEIVGKMDADFAYWPLNTGPKPGSGDDEPYGMLTEQWTPKPEGDPRLRLLALHGLLPTQAPQS